MNFDLAFDRLVTSEGGYVNDPADPGGETKFGISKRWMRRVGHGLLGSIREAGG